jgi:hypothetical protein
VQIDLIEQSLSLESETSRYKLPCISIFILSSSHYHLVFLQLWEEKARGLNQVKEKINKSMDIITTLMNLIGTPILLTTLFFMLPPFYFFKLFLSLLSSLFPEDVTNKVVLITGASSGIGEVLWRFLLFSLFFSF